jgi:hypothetical protein
VTESVALPPDLKGTGNVSEYRVYIVGSDGHFVSSVALECADDTEATEQAERLWTVTTLSFGSVPAR